MKVRRLRHLVSGVLRWPFEWLGIAVALLVFLPLTRRALWRVCDVVSFGYWLFDRTGRRVAHENLHVIVQSGRVSHPLSAAAERRIVRRAYRNMTRTVGFAFWACIRPRARAAEAGFLSEPVRLFLLRNRPAVTVSAHLGCWEILSQLAFLAGHPMLSVAKNIGTGGMTWLLKRARRSIGQEIVSAEGAFQPLMSGLKAGKSLGLLVDQRVSPRKGGQWIRFFGRPVPVSAAPAFFAAKAKAPIIVAWSHPLKDGRYRCDLIRTYESQDARDIWGLTQSIAEDLEKVIRRHPSCWILNYEYFSRHITGEEREKLDARLQKR